ncbi:MULTISPECIES: DUF6065 family protein [unclassified Mesorhizobium]|uniref:DUF6065 family protein n=1 Tax=unclassified Mesorhizobium TaxID=325217 RepID=UPI000B0D0F99|nr:MULTISPECIES: DUF6065 family protein [unclassified Mesorhizobium]
MRFFKGYPGVPDPQPGEDRLSGEIPLRAYQHCEPFLAANRVGWLLYPPVDFSIQWNGVDVFVQFDTIEEVVKLDRVFLPGFADFWIDNTDQDLVDAMPPFLELFPERGVLQVWTGFFVKTDENVSTWVRAPVNRQDSTAYKVVEGIIETDWWTGLLFTNIQLLRTDEPIQFSKSRPWFQVFEVPRALHGAGPRPQLDIVEDLSDFPSDFWDGLKETAHRRNSEKAGSYRVISRRRGRE